jgi:hypothetical protein
MERQLTREEAEEAFRAVAALRDRIAFGYLVEGCECRAQLMIEHLQGLGLEPGRAWAVSVGRPLSFPFPKDPRRSYKWRNHVAPTLRVTEVEHGVLVIDPSLTAAGPLTVSEWAAALRVRSVEVSEVALSQQEILARQAARALQGQELDAVLFSLRLGEAPIPEVGGSGFALAPDPPEGVSALAHRLMKDYLRREKPPPQET